MASRRRSNKRRQDRRYQLSDVVDTARERAWRLAPWLLVALIALGLPTLVYQGYLFTVSSPHFSVQTIEVTGAQWMSRQEALTHAQLATGDGVLQLFISFEPSRISESLDVNLYRLEFQMIPGKRPTRLKLASGPQHRYVDEWKS